MSLRTFTFWNVAGAIIWTTILTLLGYVFAGSVDAISRFLGVDVAIALVAAVVVLVAAYELRRRLRPSM